VLIREVGLVTAEKRGYWVHYSANLEKIKEFLNTVSKNLEEKVKSCKVKD